MATLVLIQNLTYVLNAASYLVRDILFLRYLSIGGSCASITFNSLAFTTPQWLPIFWNSVFIAVNLVQLVILYVERRRVVFSERERELYETVFRNFTPVEFMKLLRVGGWKEATAGEVIAREGQQLPEVMMLYNGQASVTVSGKVVAQVKDGHLIGEMSFLTEEPASATVTAATPIIYLAWPKRELRKLLERNPTMRLNLHGVIGTDMAHKLRPSEL